MGTSGFSYTEWIEAGFYPQATPGRNMLQLYARQFPIIELNYTWYQMPKAEAMERMLNRVPDGFGFTAKLTRTMTHEIDPHGWRRYVVKFREGIAPLMLARRILAILVQLPNSFDRSESHRLHLGHLACPGIANAGHSSRLSHSIRA